MFLSFLPERHPTTGGIEGGHCGCGHFLAALSCNGKATGLSLPSLCWRLRGPISSGFVATEKMIKEKPDVVKRVLRGTIKSLRYINNNGVDTTRYIAAGWKVEPALAAELYESMLRAYSPDGGMAEKAIREMMDREQERMGLKEQVPLARVVDLRLLKEVQKE
jgi:ABC-type nitrate/sulfonate/bicarbonate transport system substrate-binding protein